MGSCAAVDLGTDAGRRRFPKLVIAVDLCPLLMGDAEYLHTHTHTHTDRELVYISKIYSTHNFKHVAIEREQEIIVKYYTHTNTYTHADTYLGDHRGRNPHFTELAPVVSRGVNGWWCSHLSIGECWEELGKEQGIRGMW